MGTAQSRARTNFDTFSAFDLRSLNLVRVIAIGPPDDPREQSTGWYLQTRGKGRGLKARLPVFIALENGRGEDTVTLDNAEVSQKGGWWGCIATSLFVLLIGLFLYYLPDIG